MNDQWPDRDEPHPRREVWGTNPCGCKRCSVCGFWGMAPKPKPADKPVTVE